MTKVKLNSYNIKDFLIMMMKFKEPITINGSINAKSLFSVMKLIQEQENEESYINIETDNEYIINKFNTYIENFNKGEI